MVGLSLLLGGCAAVAAAGRLAPLTAGCAATTAPVLKGPAASLTAKAPPATIHPSPVAAPALTGAVYTLPFDPTTRTGLLPVAAAVDCGPPLILADAPEAVRQTGLTAEAPLRGTASLFYYQRNAGTSPLYILPALINKGTRSVQVTLERAGAIVNPTEPGSDMFFEYEYLDRTMHQVLTVPAGGWVWIDPAQTEHPLAGQQLAVGQFLLSATGPVTVAVAATFDPATANPTQMQVLPILHHDSAGRGVFPHSDRVVTFRASSYPAVFRLDSSNLDPYVTGTDPATGQPATDVGNYGLLYHVHLMLRGAAGTELGVFLSPSGACPPQASGTIADAEQLPAGQTLLLPADGQPVCFPNNAVLLTAVRLNAQGTAQAAVRLFPPSGLDAAMHLTVMPLAQAHLWPSSVAGAPPIGKTYPSLQAAYDNVGISADATPATANYDGAFNSYSATALAGQGVTPGATLHFDGYTVKWPDIAPGHPDNVLALGQTIRLSGSGKEVLFIGSAVYGNQTAYGTIGLGGVASERYALTMPDWFQSAAPGDLLWASAPYLNRVLPGSPHSVNLFSTTVTLPSAGAVRSVTLPFDPWLHVFYIGIVP
jgi:hypothetical protein